MLKKIQQCFIWLKQKWEQSKKVLERLLQHLEQQEEQRKEEEIERDKKERPWKYCSFYHAWCAKHRNGYRNDAWTRAYGDGCWLCFDVHKCHRRG
tara:strand:+ start:730 stop:1014 length:285 start_codon:yes stop_codon:yes gene_type:complete